MVFTGFSVLLQYLLGSLLAEMKRADTNSYSKVVLNDGKLTSKFISAGDSVSKSKEVLFL